jgi:adenylyltransferase/sulfurtransferase
LDASNALRVLAGYDLVVDGTDRFASRYLIADACEILGLPVVWGAVLRFDGQVTLFWNRPPAGCGLPAVVYRDLFPQAPVAGSVPSCAEAGVLGVVCAAVGAAMATEVIRLVTGVGEPLLGRMLVLDALTSRWREVPVRPDPHRVPVTALQDLPTACVLPGPEDPDLLTAAQLARRLADRARGADDFDLVDVRTPAERAGVVVPGSRSVPLDRFRDGTAWADLDPGRELVLCCQGGVRSAEALAAARARGFRAVHLAGGVLAWIEHAARAAPAR